MKMTKTTLKVSKSINQGLLKRAFLLMSTAKYMSELYEENKQVTSKYVHATARGHEAMQLAVSMQLNNSDFLSPYYRDDAMLLGIGLDIKEVMLQVFAKKDDPFSGGRTYYGHPSLNRAEFPKIIHQSSATGMQIIPTTGVAQGIQYLENQALSETYKKDGAVAVCSIGDGAITEGEISEAFQMAVLHQYPIIYVVQDNEWDISASSKEIRAMDAHEYAKGFKGLKVIKTEGNDFLDCYSKFEEALSYCRSRKGPVMFYGKLPLLSHHTSGVRKEWYRDDLEDDQKQDPYPLLENYLGEFGISSEEIQNIKDEAVSNVNTAYESALNSEDPDPNSIFDHIFADSPITEEQGERAPANGEEVVMVDAALHAVDSIMKTYPESILYGQDVGGELGGVFREAALLAKKYGDKRVFNTPIQEAYIIGSTNGMSAAGCKPIVEVQFADYIWPGLNQLFSEISRSNYLSNGKWPVQSLIRVPIGAYGSGGPYHSSSIESVLMQIKGIKVVYPSNAADMKGLLRASFLDPNPVVILEHKGLYWSKVPGSQRARTIEPSDDYVIPLGKGRIAQVATSEEIEMGNSILVVTYGMGVHWAQNASESFKASVEVIDLRSLNPLDEDLIDERIKLHNKCMILTEETVTHSLSESLAGRLSEKHFQILDAPIKVIGSKNVPAIPLNQELEKAVLPDLIQITNEMKNLLNY